MRTGNVSQLPSGRWSVRVSLPGGQRRRCRETFDTEAEARRVAAALVERYAEAHRTLAGYAPGWLDAREVAGARSIATWRSLWRTWLEPHSIAREPLRALTPAMVRAWVGELRQQRARQTAANALHLLRRMLAGAVDAGLLEQNPAAGVRVPGGDARTVEPWTYLEPAEIDAVLRAAGDGADLVAFAIGTGLRAGELVALRTADVHTEGDTPHVVVRYGRPPARPTKTGKIRRVPLFGLALDAARRQVARAPGAVFWPAPRGGFRSRYRVLGRVHLSDGRYADVWPSVVLEAGIGRPVRWHDLRHTCASACVSGWWGRRWTIEEVAALLGHATTTTTQRYAHLGESALAQAARETAGPAGQAPATTPRRGGRSGLKLAPPVRLERTAFGLGTCPDTEADRDVAPSRGRLVAMLLDAVRAGDEDGADAAAVALASDVLATEARLAASVLAGGPTALRDALTLAELLSPPSAAGGARGVG